MTLSELDVNDARNAADYLRGVRGTELYGPLFSEWTSGVMMNLHVALAEGQRRESLYWIARLITSGCRPEEPRR